MRRIAVLLLIGMMSMSGCAKKVLVGKLPQIQGNDFSTVYIVRDYRLILADVAFIIQLNGKDLVRIQNDECVGFRIPTGESEIALSSTSRLTEQPVIKGIKFLAEKGREYFFHVRAEPGSSGSEFKQMTYDKWLERSKNCDWVVLEAR